MIVTNFLKRFQMFLFKQILFPSTKRAHVDNTFKTHVAKKCM